MRDVWLIFPHVGPMARAFARPLAKTAFALAVLVGLPAGAQDLPDPRILPSQERPPLPPLEVPSPSPSVLPPAPLLGQEPERAIALGLEVLVRVVEIEGNSVLPPETLSEVAASYAGRRLVSEDLLDLQRRLTRLYVEAGYATSFATIPDQDLEGAVLRVRIVEGRLAGIVISGLEGFSSRYIEQRLAPSPTDPLDVIDLERRLQVLQLDPRIEAVRAQLSAGSSPGVAILEVEVVEAPRWRAQAVVSNDRPSAIGSTNGVLGAGYTNLFGRGEDIALTGVFSEGLREGVLDASVPITRYDTLLGTRLRFSDSDVVDRLFNDLDIESRFWSVELSLGQPLYRSPRISWGVGLAGELRESRNRLDGRAFETSEASNHGRLRVAVFRFSSEASYRDLVQVLAARTVLSVGAPILGADRSSNGIDDTEFVSWLGQLQWARRLPLLDLELLARVDWQLANDPLPPFERFAIGGVRTVRGYSENRLVRDNGVTGSLELRIPLVRRFDNRLEVAIAPFIDAGRAWFRERGPTPSPRTLVGAGVGLLVTFRPGLSASVYWGEQLVDVFESDSDFRDRGFHFRVTLRSF